jgi:hypothetical protein
MAAIGMTELVRKVGGIAGVAAVVLSCGCVVYLFTPAEMLVGTAVLLVAETLIWLLEALAYWRYARMAWGRAMLTSLVANLASMWLAPAAALVAVSAIVRIGGQIDWRGLLLISALATFAVELPIVWAMNRRCPDQSRLLLVAALVNLLTVPAMWLVSELLFLRLILSTCVDL